MTELNVNIKFCTFVLSKAFVNIYEYIYGSDAVS